MELSEGFVDKELKMGVHRPPTVRTLLQIPLEEGFKKNKEALTIKELMSLEVGDFVVHIDHGIGEFSGLHKIEVNGKMQEAIRLTYRGGDVLYVSIHSLHRISKYSSKEGTQPKINKLGTNTWAKTKQKTKGVSSKSRTTSAALRQAQIRPRTRLPRGRLPAARVGGQLHVRGHTRPETPLLRPCATTC